MTCAFAVSALVDVDFASSSQEVAFPVGSFLDHQCVKFTVFNDGTQIEGIRFDVVMIMTAGDQSIGNNMTTIILTCKYVAVLEPHYCSDSSGMQP